MRRSIRPKIHNIEIAAHNTGQDTIEISVADEGEGVPVGMARKDFRQVFSS